MAYVSPLWLLLVVPHLLPLHHRTVWSARYLPPARKLRLRLHCLRAGVQEDGDRSKADLGTRDTHMLSNQ